MSEPKVIAAWPRNSSETLQVRLDSYRGRDIVDIRCWYTDRAGELKPGKTGISLSVAQLPNLAKAINDALADAKARGIVAAEGRSQ